MRSRPARKETYSRTGDKDGRGQSFLLTFTTTSHLLLLAPALVFSVATAFLLPVQAVLFGRIFNTFADYGSQKIEDSKLKSQVLECIYGLIIAGGCTWFLKCGLFTCWLAFGELQAKCLREKLFLSLLSRDLEWFELRPAGVGSLLIRMQTQIRDFQLATSQPCGLAITSIIQALVAFGLALYTNWKLALVVLASIPLIVGGVAVISRPMQSYISSQNAHVAQASRVANFAITNIVTVKCCNAQEKELSAYTAFIKDAGISYMKLARSNALQSGFVRFMATTIFVQGFWYGGSQVHSGATTAGKVITTFWSCLIVTKSFEELLPQIVVLEKGRSAAAALNAILHKIAKGKLNKPKRNGYSPQFCDGHIQFKAVSFAYPARPKNLVLCECSISFPAGQLSFVVGQSGSGKSTLSSLLTRLYQPLKGCIVIDDNDVRCLDTSWLRNNITLVQQQCHLFDETIGLNVALGRYDFSQVPLHDLEDCLRFAMLDKTVADLPSGIETKVGSAGAALSGGQKQRVALARARLRDTPILVLDEATSALDIATRSAVMEAVRSWRLGKTTIIITHDLDMIEDEDVVFVLENGRVARKGRRKDIEINGPSVTRRRENSWGMTLASAESSSSIVSPRMNHKKGMHVTNLLRNDSFEEEFVLNERTAALSLHEADEHPSMRRATLRTAFTVGKKATINNLRRQSLARAKVLYNEVPVLPPLPLHANYGPNYHLHNKKLSTSISLGSKTSGGRVEQSLRRESQDSASNAIELHRLSIRSDHLSVSTDAALFTTLSIGDILATVWGNLDAKHSIQSIVAVVAALIHAGSPPAFSFMLAQVLSTFYMSVGYKHKLLVYSLSILGIAVVDGICSFAKEFLLDSVAQFWLDALRMSAFARILRQPKSWFDEETNSASVLVPSLDASAEEMKDLVGKFAARVMIVFVMMLASVTWSFISCWKLTLVSLAATPALYAIMKSFSISSSYWESHANDAGKVIGIVFVDTFTDIKTVRALTLEPYFHQKFKTAVSRAFSIGIRRAIYGGLFYGLSDSSIIFLTALIFWYGARLVEHREWQVKSVLVSISLLLFCTASAGVVLSLVPRISSAVDTATRLLRLARMDVLSHEEGGTDLPLESRTSVKSDCFCFHNLTFHYPSRPQAPALRALSMTIPSNLCTVIVGASGSGKSTIASLVLGLYCTPGVVSESTGATANRCAPLTIWGHDIRTLDASNLRSRTAVVLQTPVLVSGTIYDNICYGLSPTSPLRSQAKVEAAARSAGIHEFVDSLPQGYATIVGEGGMGVSGGQAQRIVVARALICQAPILILDEPTSALDQESAGVIKRSIMQLRHDMRGKMTIIVITHSKEMMDFADHVIVMEQGAVVEEGSYLGLLTKRGKLWKMLEAGIT